MNRFWNNIIQPIIKSINVSYIVEVGSETGINTKNILEYCKEHNAHLTAIEPIPQFDVDEFKAEYGDKFEIYIDLSLSILPLLENYDVIFLDGDHNWYTVYNELKIIEKTFENGKFPLIFFHDVSWPYARRDLYYNPENIPEAYKQPYKQQGMYPGQTSLKENGGFNRDFYHAIYENNLKNGVLTAIEDFIDESDLEFSFETVNAFHGLGILFPKNIELESIVKDIINNSNFLDLVEEERIKQYIEQLESKIAHSKTKNFLKGKVNENQKKIRDLESNLNEKEVLFEKSKDEINEKKLLLDYARNNLLDKESLLDQVQSELNEKELLLDYARNNLLDKESLLDQVQSELNEKESLLDQAQNELNQTRSDLGKKELLLEQTRNGLKTNKELFKNEIKKSEKQFKELLSQNNSLKANFYEMRYASSVGRPLIWKLISRFPSTYILLNFSKTGIKNALLTIKGYRAIKRNNLFDIGFYLKNNGDVRVSGKDPIIHYLYHGFKEGRQPNPNFDGDYYLETHGDVRNSNLNPLVHYSLYGIHEDRKTVKKSGFKVTLTSKNESTGFKTSNNAYANKKIIDDHETNYIFDLFENAYEESSDFVDCNDHLNVKLGEDDIKLIAFYLPQFHPFPENDKWWGKGFTEWANVTKAIPMFQGHYQPHLPIDLGFYDLRLIENLKRQVELAKQYGLYGFCFHYYWFNGHKLMETPLKTLFENQKDLDFPFCICWANENWTRRWDGNEDDILISQNYSPEDDLAFIKEISKYLKDDRYIKVGKKPLIIVYKPQILPNPQKTFYLWRKYCRDNNIGEIFIMGARRHDFVLEPEEYGLDSAVEFPPNHPHPSKRMQDVKYVNPDYEPTVFDLETFVKNRHYMVENEDYKKFKAVFPSWDNTPRRLNHGQVYVGNPVLYKEWLKDVITYTKEEMDENEQFVFINAWNEWAEGAHLEPDRKYGYAYLKATADAIVETRVFDRILLESKHKVSVIMPTYNRKDVVDKSIDSVLNQTFSNYQLIICDDGSTDGTDQLIKLKYWSHLQSEKILYVKQDNEGVSKARNTALKHASGDLIAYLDSDNYWDHQYLEQMVAVFHQNNCNTAYCAMEVLDNHDNPQYGKNHFIRNEGYDREKLLKANFIDLNVFMHRKSLYEKMGGFNESMKSMVDWDLILRYTRYNEPFFLNEVLATYILDKNLDNITYNIDHNDDYLKLSELHSYEKIMKERVENIKKPSKISSKGNSKKKITIKIAATDWETAHNWGDYHFALALKKEFERNNYETLIQIHPEWNKEVETDIVLVLRGLFQYKINPKHFNIMWNISHPDMVSVGEYNEYDHVFVASEILAKDLKDKVDVPVEPLLQCTDPELFYPDPSLDYKHELLFAGNSRNVFRKIIKDLLPTKRDLGLYGTYWDQFVGKKYICGEHIPNNELRKAYSSCEILLNDHWDDMAEKGFISNRIFDGFAAGAFIISDEVNGAKDIFGDQLVTYKNSEDLDRLVDYYLNHPQERGKKVEKGKDVVLQHHTFEKRAARILEIIEESEKTCPICNSKSSTFLPYGIFPRRNALCPVCGSLERHRSTYLFLTEETNIFDEDIKMLHIAPEAIFAEIFSAKENINYLPVDLDDENLYVEEKMDIQDINYPNNTFNFILCSHVLEHVPNDRKAMKELFRVLKPYGNALISVPIRKSSNETYEDPAINTPELRRKHYGQEDHLRYYGLDFKEKLEDAGFEVVTDDYIKNLDKNIIKKYSLSYDDHLFFCTK